MDSEGVKDLSANPFLGRTADHDEKPLGMLMPSSNLDDGNPGSN